MDAIANIAKNAFCWVILALSSPLKFTAQYFINPFIEFVTKPIPNYPDSLTFVRILEAIQSFLPESGGAEIMEILYTLLGLFSLYIVVKLYKLLPFT